MHQYYVVTNCAASRLKPRRKHRNGENSSRSCTQSAARCGGTRYAGATERAGARRRGHRSCATTGLRRTGGQQGRNLIGVDGTERAGRLDGKACQQGGAIDIRRRRRIRHGKCAICRRRTCPAGDHQWIAPLCAHRCGDDACLRQDGGLRDDDVVLNVADKLRQDQSRAGSKNEHMPTPMRAPCRNARQQLSASHQWRRHRMSPLPQGVSAGCRASQPRRPRMQPMKLP